VVSDLYRTDDSLIGIIQRDIDVVISPLLPIAWPWFTRGGSLGIGSWQPIVDLKESIGRITMFVVRQRLGMGGKGGRKDNKHGCKEGAKHADSQKGYVSWKYNSVVQSLIGLPSP